MYDITFMQNHRFCHVSVLQLEVNSGVKKDLELTGKSFLFFTFVK